MTVLTSNQIDDLLKAIDSDNDLVFHFYRIRCTLRGILQRPTLSRRERTESEALIDYLCSPDPKENTDLKIYPCLVEEDETL